MDVHAEGLGRRCFKIVGSNEADIRAGRISASSPLVTWHRPVGDLALTVDAIRYDGAAAGP